MSLTVKATKKLAEVLARDPVAQSMDDIDLIASQLPPPERLRFLERQHMVWARQYARLAPEEAEAERLMLADIWDRIMEILP